MQQAGATLHRGARASHRRGLSHCRAQGSRRAGSAIVAHGPSRSAARGILPDQGPNPRPLHWQADSQPLRHQGSPKFIYLIYLFLAVLGLCCSVRAFSSRGELGGYSSLLCTGFSLQWLLLLWSTGSRHAVFSSCSSRALARRLSSCGTRA